MREQRNKKRLHKISKLKKRKNIDQNSVQHHEKQPYNWELINLIYNKYQIISQEKKKRKNKRNKCEPFPVMARNTAYRKCDHYASIRERELASNLQALSPAVSMYYVTSFDVTRYNQNFRLSDSSLLIQFSDATALKKSSISLEWLTHLYYSLKAGQRWVLLLFWTGKSEDLEVLETKGYLLIFLTISPLPEMGSSSVLESRI
ncbi:hypothetical protein YC2023_039523 [Brassica napus]